MNFEHPRLFWLALALLPLLALFFWATWRKRQAMIRQFVQHKSLAQAVLSVSAPRQKIRRVLLFCAVAFLLLTIARPQWGFTWEEASQRGRDIIVAIDTSRSMLAADMQPDRLTRAKLAALDLLKLGKNDRFGLVAFSGTAFLQCPLTYDDEAFRQSVQILQAGIIPQGGTAIGPAIDAAREAFGEDADENHRILVLFTDGEDHEQEANEIVSDAADTGMRIFTIGVGTPAGELLRARDEQGQLAYVKDNAGNVVKSRLNEKVLQEIATRGGGFYLQLQGGSAMEVLYQKGLAPLPTSERTTKLLKRFKEQFYWPLAVAILLLLFEVFIPEQKRPVKTKTATPPAPVAVTAALLLLLAIPGAAASPAQAQRHYKAGEYDRALSAYQEALGKAPNDARLHYNAGAAAYQANKFDHALKEFQAAAASPDLDLQQQSFYNLGNAEFRLGENAPDPKTKMAVWEQAVQHYDAALKLNSIDKDAEFNRDFVRKKLEELKQDEQKKNENKDNEEKNQQDEDDSSKDEQKKDNKDEQKKDDESQQDKKSKEQKKDNPSEQDQKKSEEEKQKQQDQQKQEQGKKDQSDQAKQGDRKESDQKPDSDEQGQYAQLGKMTPAQAKQLLDAQRDEEKALLFLPPERKSDARDRTFKDW